MAKSPRKAINLRHREFILFYLKTGNAAQAYQAAGYKPSTRNSLDVCASRLLNSAKVQREIAKAQARIVKAADITVETLLSDLEEDRQLARKVKQPGSAIRATELKAKLTGHLVERKETGAPGEFVALRTRDDVLDAMRKELGEQAVALLLQVMAGKPVPQLIEASPYAVAPSAQLADSSDEPLANIPIVR